MQKLLCKYCAHNWEWQFEPDDVAETLEDALDSDYEVLCPNCGCPVRLNEAIEREEVEIEDVDREAIAEQVKQGFTSGRLDSDGGKKISWSLDIEAWRD